ncbi:MAG: coagulation factor 5/8 type domain-containing protein, partial [Candidatus Eisenbacteria bacterium]
MKRAVIGLLFFVSAAAFAGAAGVLDGRPAVLDDFEDVGAWSAYAADGVEVGIRKDAALGRPGSALRIDFGFKKGSGYGVVRREFDPPVDLPENYAFSFELRGEAPANHLEFKLIDESGENVWWSVRRDFAFPVAWETVRVKKRQITFAWGPRGGG